MQFGAIGILIKPLVSILSPICNMLNSKQFGTGDLNGSGQCVVPIDWCLQSVFNKPRLKDEIIQQINDIESKLWPTTLYPNEPINMDQFGWACEALPKA